MSFVYGAPKHTVISKMGKWQMMCSMFGRKWTRCICIKMKYIMQIGMCQNVTRSRKEARAIALLSAKLNDFIMAMDRVWAFQKIELVVLRLFAVGVVNSMCSVVYLRASSSTTTPSYSHYMRIYFLDYLHPLLGLCIFRKMPVFRQCLSPHELDLMTWDWRFATYTQYSEIHIRLCCAVASLHT